VSFIGHIDNAKGHEHRHKYKRSVPFTHITGVFGDEHNKAVNRSKINLNFSPENLGGCSVRIYKLLQCGAFILTTPWYNMEETFTIGKHLDVFKTPEELRDKIKYYLNNPNEMEKIRKNAYELSKQYSVSYWANQITNL
jgi:spore maturation protein CgeB